MEVPADCPLCDFKLESRKELNFHYTTHHDKTKGCCVECLEIVPVEDLFRHLNSHYEKEKSILCTICGKGFRFRNELTIHLSYHDDSGNKIK